MKDRAEYRPGRESWRVTVTRMAVGLAVFFSGAVGCGVPNGVTEVLGRGRSSSSEMAESDLSSYRRPPEVFKRWQEKDLIEGYFQGSISSGLPVWVIATDISDVNDENPIYSGIICVPVSDPSLIEALYDSDYSDPVGLKLVGVRVGDTEHYFENPEIVGGEEVNLYYSTSCDPVSLRILEEQLEKNKKWREDNQGLK